MESQKRILHGLISMLILALSTFVHAQTNQCLQIGQNVGAPNRYNGSYTMFKNIMFGSTAFSTANPNVNNYSYIPTDENGYPNAGLPATVTAYTHPNNMVTFYGQIIQTTAMQASPQDFPWGAVGTPTDSSGIYTVFWEGSGTLQLIYNRYVGGSGAQIIATAGTYGTITTSGTSYYGGDKVTGMGITGISATTITTNNMPGLHYCQFRIPNGLNTDSRGGFDVTLMVSQPAPNHLRNIAFVYPNSRALGNSMGTVPSMTKILPSEPYNAFVDPKNPEFFLNKPFNPMFLNWFRGFKILRFMDAMGANGIDYEYDQNWLTRRPKGYYSQSNFHDGKVGISMAYEWIIDIANEVGADPWINASTTGDENHYQQMARLFRQNLDPSLKIYLELGNEQWNFGGGFNTFFMLQNYATNNNIPYGPNGAAAVKEGQLWRSFFNEYGIDSLKCKRVCSGFPGNPDVTRGKVMYHQILKQNWDYFSMTWYFSNTGPMSGAQSTYWGGVGDITGTYNIASTTPAQYNAEMKARIGTPIGYGGFLDEILSMTNMANGFQKKVLGYEGGLGSWEASSGRTIQDPALFAKFDPSIRDLYKVVLDTIRNHPEIEAICNFADFGGNGSGPQNNGFYGYGTGTSIMTDTSATGNSVWPASFGSYNIYGTNKTGLWKELLAQQYKPSICEPQSVSDNTGPGNALKFNSDRFQFVDYLSSTNLNSTADFSFEIWVKPEDANKTMDVLAFTNQASSSMNALRIDAANHINWIIKDASGNQVLSLGGPLVENGKWYHIAAVKQSGNCKLYVNGSVVAVGSATGTYSSNRINLGASIVNSGAPANYFRGQLDELRIWNGGALAATTIQDFMCKKLKPTHPNYGSLSNYVVFNSITGNNLFDLKTGTSATNALNNFSSVSGTLFYVTSGAPIGDESLNIYPGSWTAASLTYTSPAGDIVQISGMGNGVPDGAHLYVVNGTPTLNALPNYYTGVGQNKYFGVFMANGANPNYNIKYYYQGNPDASGTDDYNRLIKRGDNSDNEWINGGAVLDDLSKSLTINCREFYRSEYNIGVRQSSLRPKQGSGKCVSFNVGTLTGGGGKMVKFYRSDEYTISFWAVYRGPSWGNVLWFGNKQLGQSGYQGGPSNMYALYSAGSMYTRFSGVITNANNYAAGPNFAGGPQWNHYAITKQGTTLNLFINGMLAGNGLDAVNAVFTELDIATMGVEYSVEFKGEIDELSIWSQPFSLGQIRDLMCKKVTPVHPEYCNLKAYFRFDQGSGTVVENEVGGGDLVMNGASWLPSGAALGDESVHNYNAPFTVTMTHPDGDALSLDYLLRGSQHYGTQMFRVNESPYYTGTVPSGVGSMDNSRYWGMYEIGIQNYQQNTYRMNYRMTYNYAANKNINLSDESTLTVLDRKENDAMDWIIPSTVMIDNSAKTVTVMPEAYTITGLNTTTNQFTLPNHGLNTCDIISYYYEGTALTYNGGSPVSLNSTFNVKVIDANTVELFAADPNLPCTGLASSVDVGTLGTGLQFFVKTNNFKRDELWFANSSVNGFINSTAIPTIGGVNGKAKVCQAETDLTYRIKAPVDINALQFIWTGSSGLAVGTSNKDTVLVSVISPGASIETLSVVGVNRNGKTTPPYVFTITVTGTGSHSADITGVFSSCALATNLPYSISGVSPVPMAYYWSVTGMASFAGANTGNATALNFSENAGNVILSVYGQYACGTSLINTMTIKNSKLPNLHLPVEGGIVCSATTVLDPKITVRGSEMGVVYSAFDITGSPTLVGSISGTGGPVQINYDRTLLMPWSIRTIQIKASNSPCTIAILDTTVTITLSNTLSGTEMANVFFNGPTVASCFALSQINLFNITLTGTRQNVTYTPYVFNYNINYPYYDFAYNLGADVVAQGNTTLLTVKPDAFDYWYAYGAPNTIGGMAMAPGCPAQRLPNVYDLRVTRASPAVIASKIAGYTGLRGDDDDPAVCSINNSTFYTTAWGGNQDVFLGRQVLGTTQIGSPNITITSNSISLADIDINDVLYIQDSYQNSLGGGVLYVVSKTSNTLKVSNTLGGAVVTATSANLNFTIWAPVTIPQINNGDQYITLPAKYTGHGLRLYSQVKFYTTTDVMIQNLPSPLTCTSCAHIYYVISINGNNVMFSRLPNSWGPENSMAYHVERGTLSVINGSNVVNGTGTRFGQDLYGAAVVQAGDILRDDNDLVIGTVGSVSSTTQLTLTSNYTGSTRSGFKYSFMRPLIFGANAFGGPSKSVVLSTGSDAWDGSVANENGFDWKVTPAGAVASIVGLGGTFIPSTGEYVGNPTAISSGINTSAGEGFSNRVKNGVTVIWNETFAGTAAVAVRTTNQCGTSVYVYTEDYTPGYERTQISVNVNAKVPSTPDPISFADVPLCNVGSNSVFSTSATISSGGYQWQVLNAGTSDLTPNGYCPCVYDHISSVPGAKTGTCTGVSCTANTSTPITWDKYFSGVATVQVRAYGCDQMTPSPWVMANVTVTNATSIAANITGATSICAQANSPYNINAVPVPVESSKWFLLPANTVDIYSGLIAYYNFDNLTTGTDLAANISPAPQTIGISANMTEGGSSVSAASNKLAAANSAANFNGGGGYFTTPANSGFDFSRELTLSVWVNYTDDNTGNPYIIYAKGDRYQGAPCCGQAIGAMMIGLAQGTTVTGSPNLGSDRKLSIYWDDFISTMENSLTTDPSVNDAYSDVVNKPVPISDIITPGIWHHVVLTAKPNAFYGMDFKAYVDGVQSGSTVTMPGGFFPTVYPADERIGSMKNSGHNFKGLMDELALYRRALSPAEIQALGGLNPLLIKANPAASIGGINVNSGQVTWLPTFTGVAKIVNVPTVCSGDGYPVYLTVTVTSQPSISGVDFTDPTTCASDASGTVLVTLTGYNGTISTFLADLNGGGYGANAKTGTISGTNVITISGSMPPGYIITQLALNQPGVACKIQPELYSIAPEHVTGGVVPPSAAVSANVFSLNPQCNNTDAIIRLSGSENGINYFAMIGSKMVSTTLLGSGGITDLTVAGNNLTSSGADMAYSVKILAQRSGCIVVTLTGVPIITVNGTANFVYASNSYCNNYLGTVAPNITGTGGSFNSSPAGLIISSNGVITPLGSTVNSNYTIGYTISISGGCVQTTSITGFAITQPVTTAQIVFGYNNSAMGSGPVFCTNSSSPSPSPNLSLFGGSYTAKDAGNNNANAMVSAADGILLFNDNTVGNYTIFYIIPMTSICGAVMSQTNVTVNSVPIVPVLNYGSGVYCSDILKIETLNPLTGGRYVSSQGSINSITGTLQNVNQGAVAGIRKIYSISYINTVAGCSSQPNATTVTVTGAPAPPVFNYSSDGTDVFCNINSVNPIPALSGYVFTFTGDVSKALSLDPSTGKINLKSSDAGIWQVTYVIPAIDACKASQGGPLITILSSVGGKATATIPDIGICEETNATILLSGNTGDPVKWQVFSNNKWNDLDQDLNSLSLTTSTLTGGTYYYRTAVQLGNCPVAYSAPDTVYVAQYPIAGTATVEGSASKVMICDKEQTVLTLTGFTGTIQWQSTMDSTATSWNDVNNETASETANSGIFTTPALIGYSHKTIELREFFKAKVVNGPCAVPVYSNMIKVYKCGQALSIPNALTPNSGDQNSVWDLSELRLTSAAKVKIFNRYGTEVYSTTGEILKNNGNTWDGHNLSAGTYYYVIEDAGSKKTGAVTVIK